MSLFCKTKASFNYTKPGSVHYFSELRAPDLDWENLVCGSTESVINKTSDDSSENVRDSEHIIVFVHGQEHASDIKVNIC